jgi:hypothetical protein
MAGMVACLWQAFPQKNKSRIRELIVKASDGFSPNNQYNGIPDFAGCS